MILITDTSHWKGSIDFQILKENGITANYAKATEGTDFLDSEFYSSVIDMELHNMLWGAYHYFRMVDPIKQANHFYNVAKNTQLPPVIDVEKINNLNYNKTNFTNTLKQMVDETQKLFGRKVMIYTGYYAWLELTTCPVWAKENKLWLASYRSTIPTLIPQPWTRDDFILWQYTDREKIGSIYPIDCNYFFGTQDDLYNLANVKPPKTLEQRVADLELRVSILEGKC